LSFYLSITIIILLVSLFLEIDLEKFISLIEKNKISSFDTQNELFYLITGIFFLFSILWTFFLGLGIPLFLFVGFFYDILFGAFLLVTSRSIGATILYIFLSKFYSKDIINYLKKKNYVDLKLFKFIKKNTFKFFTTVRMFPGIPYQFPDLLPLLFKMKFVNYFFSKYIGSLLSNIVIIYLMNNIFVKMELKHSKQILDIDLSLIISIVIFFSLFLLGFYLKKKYFKFN